MERIGFIGLGSQGGPMAHRIADAGMPLVVWARRAQVLEAYTAKGAQAAASIAALGAECDHVGICVLNDADVAQVCDRLIPAMRPGSRIAIHSTILPENCIALARRTVQHGIDLIDAPVSGGEPAAKAGTLTVMCGGTQEVFDAARTVFETFGRLIVLLGDAGAGQRAKLVNNALLSANIGMAMAATQAASAFGIDRTALNQLIAESSGRSFGFEVYSRLPAPAAFAMGAQLLLKDVNLLMAALPGDAGAQALHSAADAFLTAATDG